VEVQVQLNPHSTPAQESGVCSAPSPGHFNLRQKIRYPSYRSLVGPHFRSRWVWKILPPPLFEPRTFQPLATHYTDAIPATLRNVQDTIPQRRLCLSRKPPKPYLYNYKVYTPFSVASPLTMFVISKSIRSSGSQN
jgi:hypothetical protein